MPTKKSVDIDDRVDQVAQMKERGYIPATEIAAKMGNTLTTISRWASEGKVESLIVSGKRYVTLKSLVAHITPGQARIFGFLPKFEAKKKTGGVT